MNTSSKRARQIALLGATGSIGRSALSVISARPDEFELSLATCRGNASLLREIAGRFSGCDSFCLESPGDSTLSGVDAVLEMLRSDRVEIVVCAIQGIAALPYVLAALESGKRVCLATKEVLVGAGEWVTRVARAHGGLILPVDSEHCAIFQCLRGEDRSSVRNLWLTCSGGPFHARPEVDLHSVTVEEALRHPTWSMGRKITLDCATLMNKALEMIEAHWLFGVPEPNIRVVIHPQSVVHSMVEFNDGAVIAQLAATDMRLPIQYCLDYPDRMAFAPSTLDFSRRLSLEFMPPDEVRFPALGLARRALRQGGSAGAVLNAANDAALERFLAGELAFDEIPRAVDRALDYASPIAPDSTGALEEAAETARRIVNAG